MLVYDQLSLWAIIEYIQTDKQAKLYKDVFSTKYIFIMIIKHGLHAFYGL